MVNTKRNQKNNQGVYMKFLDKPIFAFTFDTDWCPDFMVSLLLDLMEELGIKITPFLTDSRPTIEYTSVLKEYKKDMEVVGIHPRVNAQDKGSLMELSNEFRYLYPEAEGYRSHAFVDSYYLTETMSETGYKWQSNHYCHMQKNLQPIRKMNGFPMVEFPIWFEDNIWLRTLEEPKQILKDLAKPGLKVINVHPKWVYENSGVEMMVEALAGKVDKSYYLKDLL